MLEIQGIEVNEEEDYSERFDFDFDLLHPLTPSLPSIQPSHSSLKLENLPLTGLISIFSVFAANQNN